MGIRPFYFTFVNLQLNLQFNCRQNLQLNCRKNKSTKRSDPRFPEFCDGMATFESEIPRRRRARKK